LGTPNLSRAAAPHESTILNFRHLLEKHELCGKILDLVNHYQHRKRLIPQLAPLGA
jgi:IS5 family transposase